MTVYHMPAMCVRYWRHYEYGLGEDRQGLTVLLKMGFMGQKVVCASSHLQGTGIFCIELSNTQCEENAKDCLMDCHQVQPSC